jgi:hypothetical protein
MQNDYTCNMSKQNYAKCIAYAHSKSTEANNDWKGAFNEKAREIHFSKPINKNLTRNYAYYENDDYDNSVPW